MRRTLRRWFHRLAVWASRVLTLVLRRPYRASVIPIERITVKVPDLPPHLHHFTIGVMSDLHLGRLVDTNYVRSAAEALAAEHPDLVVIAGDLISEAAAVSLLPEVLAPVRGARGCMGNWDNDHADAMLAQQTVPMLVNRGVEAAPGLWLCGVDEAVFGAPDLDAALAGAPSDAVRILLCHEPDYADRVTARHRIACQISGHSHGGQIRLPFIGPLLLPPLGRKYVAGLYRAPHCQVYTTRGLGVAHLPLRILCPPELTLIRLQATN